MPPWVAVMLGGALGALARHATNTYVTARLDGTPLAGFPLATLLVNVTGSFTLAFLTALTLRGLVTPEARMAIGTGFVGAFTTFSTFEVEADTLYRQGQHARLAAYVIGNVALGYAAVLAGRALAERLTRP